MTTATKINDMAELAARSAIDAFEKDQLPPATMAYSFVYQLEYDEVDEPLPPQLTAREFRHFRHDYCRWLRNLGVSTDTAQVAAFGKPLQERI